MPTFHPVCPPHEVIFKWFAMLKGDRRPVEDAWVSIQVVTTEAARWGADQELEACVELLNKLNLKASSDMLLALRRKDSLVEQRKTGPVAGEVSTHTSPALPPGAWKTSSLTCKALMISRTTLQALKDQGTFKAGVHYYRKGAGANGSILWDIDACRQALRDRTFAATLGK